MAIEEQVGDAHLTDFHPDDPNDIDFRPFNPLSLMAFVLAVLALLTIANYLFLAIGLVAIGISIWAMAGCDGGRRRTGYRLAQTSLFLAVAGIVMGYSYNTGRLSMMISRAREKADQWIVAVSNDRLEEALSYANNPLRRPDPGTDLYKFYEGTEKTRRDEQAPVQAINTWMSNVPMSYFIEDRLAGRHEFVGTLEVGKSLVSERIKLWYRYLPADKSLNPLDYIIETSRITYNGEPGVQWTVQVMRKTGKLTGKLRAKLESPSSTGDTTPRPRIK